MVVETHSIFDSSAGLLILNMYFGIICGIISMLRCHIKVKKIKNSNQTIEENLSINNRILNGIWYLCILISMLIFGLIKFYITENDIITYTMIDILKKDGENEISKIFMGLMSISDWYSEMNTVCKITIAVCILGFILNLICKYVRQSRRINALWNVIIWFVLVILMEECSQDFSTTGNSFIFANIFLAINFINLAILPNKIQGVSNNDNN